MAKTNLDEIVNFPNIAIRELSKNQNFVSLLTNIPNADLNDEDTEFEWNNCTNDFDYVEGIIQETKSFCCVDTEIEVTSNTIKEVYLTVLVGVHRNNMSLKGTNFKGIAGNRRDNLIRELDYTLRNDSSFGIGGLELVGRIRAASVAGKEFSCKVATYRVPNFANLTR